MKHDFLGHKWRLNHILQHFADKNKNLGSNLRFEWVYIFLIFFIFKYLSMLMGALTDVSFQPQNWFTQEKIYSVNV